MGIRKFLKGWCYRKNEGRGTMGTLSQLGSKQEGGGPWWERSCSINGLNLTALSEFPAVAGSCLWFTKTDEAAMHSLLRVQHRRNTLSM